MISKICMLLLILYAIWLIILILFYKLRHPYDRMQDRYDQDIYLLKRYSTKNRIVHMETHARRAHILSEIMRKNGHHFAKRKDSTESLSYVLPDDLSPLQHAAI